MKHFIVLAIVFFLMPVFSLFAEERTWTDRSGDFQIVAALLDFNGKEVKLKKKGDGKIISLALEKLSIPDQVYVKKMMESLTGNDKPTPVPKEAVPKEDSEDEETSQGDDSLVTFKGKIPVTRISTARQIRIDLTKSSWSIPADSSKVKNLNFPVQPLDFPYGKQDFFTRVRMEGIAFADDVPEKVLTAISFSFQGQKKSTKVFFGDMKSHRIISQTFPAALHVFGLSPDGSKALFLQETMDGRRERKVHLTIADMTQPKLPCIGVLFPFAEFKSDRSFNSETEIDWADWIDNEHILVQSKDGRIVMLGAKTGVAVWTLKASSGLVILSPGKKYLIARSLDRGMVYVLLETQTGKPIGQLLLDKEEKIPGFLTAFAFSPNGTRIAGYVGGWIHLWDATNGNAKESFYIGSTVVLSRNLFWLDNLYLLVGNVLVETKQQLPIWKYTNMNSEDTVFAGKYWHVEPPNSRDISLALFGLTIPHETIPKLPALDDSQNYCIRPGVAVKLNVDLAIPDFERVRDYVRTVLRNNGTKISDEAPITLNVGIQTEETKEIYYGEFIGRNITGRANFTPHTMFYRFEQDGKVLWETRSQSIAPSSISNEDLKNRSLQDVVNERGKLTSSWYLSVELPKKIPFDKAGTSSILSAADQRH